MKATKPTDRGPRKRASPYRPKPRNDEFAFPGSILGSDDSRIPRAKYMHVKLTDNKGRALRIGKINTQVAPLKIIFGF